MIYELAKECRKLETIEITLASMIANLAERKYSTDLLTNALEKLIQVRIELQYFVYNEKEVNSSD